MFVAGTLRWLKTKQPNCPIMDTGVKSFTGSYGRSLRTAGAQQNAVLVA